MNTESNVGVNGSEMDLRVELTTWSENFQYKKLKDIPNGRKTVKIDPSEVGKEIK